MEEQVLKDFIATVQKNNYNYDVVIPKFPELKDVDLQVLKDYVATAEANNYDYSIINPKFPELGFGVKKKTFQSLLGLQRKLWSLLQSKLRQKIFLRI